MKQQFLFDEITWITWKNLDDSTSGMPYAVCGMVYIQFSMLYTTIGMSKEFLIIPTQVRRHSQTNERFKCTPYSVRAFLFFNSNVKYEQKLQLITFNTREHFFRIVSIEKYRFQFIYRVNLYGFSFVSHFIRFVMYPIYQIRCSKSFLRGKKKKQKRVFAIFLSRYWKNSKILFVRVKAPENEIQIKSMTAGPQVTQNKNEKNVWLEKSKSCRK